MKRAALYLAFALSCAFSAQGQTTQIVASHINYFAGAPVTGTFCVSPVNASGQPVNLSTPSGQQLAGNIPVCFPVTAGVLSSTAIIPDTSLAQPVNACIQISIFDSTGLQIGNSYPCAQPSGSAWNFDSYIPTSLSVMPQLPPLFLLNGALANSQVRQNLRSGNGVTVAQGANGDVTFNGTIAGALCSGNENMPFTATPNFSTATCSSRMALTASATFALAAGSDGQTKCLEFVHDGSSTLYTVTPPANVVGFFAVGTVPSKRSQQCFNFFQADAVWVATSPGVVNQ